MQVLFSQPGFISFPHGEREPECVDGEFFTFAPRTGTPIYSICPVNAVFRCPVRAVRRSFGFFFFVCTLTERLNVSSRQRKDELEQRMSSLQESRRELMVQLEGLMKLLKVMNAAGPPFFGWWGGALPLPLLPVSVPSTGSALASVSL